MKTIITCCLLLFFSSIHAQCGFLIDSTTNLQFSLQGNSFLNHVKYQYDDQSRVKSIKDDFSIYEYEYQDATYIVTEYNASRTFIHQKTVTYYDGQERAERVEIYTNDYLHNYDSLVYSQNDQLLTLYHYAWDVDDQTFYQTLLKVSTFNDSGEILSHDYKYYNHSGIQTYFKTEYYAYDQNGLIWQESTANNFSFGSIQKDTITMTYQGAVLTSQLTVTYYDDLYYYGVRNTFDHISDTTIIRTFLNWDVKTNPFQQTSIEYFVSSDNCVQSTKSGSQINFTPDGQQVVTQTWSNLYRESLSGDTAFVRRELKHLDINGTLQTIFVNQEIWKRNPLNLQTSENTDVSIYPNPVPSNGMVYLKSSIEIDSYFIVNSSGKLVTHHAGNGTAIESLVSPILPGIYYISFLSKGKVLTNAKLLSVF